MNDKIRAFIEKHINNNSFTDDDNVFELGFVNSLFAMQLVAFIEKEFGVNIENEDLELSNFKSVNSISAFVTKKLN